MADYVVYHNPDVMGYGALDVGDLSIYTNKDPGNVAGSRVWLLTGEGSPRKFLLRATFLISEVRKSDRPEFKTRVLGKAGTLMHPMPVLNDEPWFNQFKKSQGNFAFGFQPIGEPDAVAGLHALFRASTHS